MVQGYKLEQIYGQSLRLSTCDILPCFLLVSELVTHQTGLLLIPVLLLGIHSYSLLFLSCSLSYPLSSLLSSSSSDSLLVSSESSQWDRVSRSCGSSANIKM